MLAGFVAVIVVLIVARVLNSYNIHNLYTTGNEEQYVVTLLTGIVSTVVELLLVVGLIVAARRSGKDRFLAEEAAQRLSVTLASIGDALAVTDAQGGITRLNPVAETLTGWREAEAAGRRVEDILPLLDEETSANAESPFGSVLRNGSVSRLRAHTVLISKNGRKIPVDESAAPIRIADGKIAGVVMVLRDITENRRRKPRVKPCWSANGKLGQRRNGRIA
jgi:PAS domain S-box-containing protein